MRVALISDIHGNEVALRAVLRSIERVGVDLVVCLGDVATLGPRPDFVLDKLSALACPCILGNHDDFLLDPALIHTYTEAPFIVEAVDRCRASLSSSALAFVGTFRDQLEIPLEGEAKLFVFHGSPRSHMENVLATTPPEELDTFLDGHAATVMAGGHTHIQMVRQHRGTLLVNPGSVGLAFERFVGGGPPKILPHAEYAVVEATAGEVSVTAHRVALDKSALRDSMKDWDNPLQPHLLAAYA
jgi:putative phosphoesterase